MKKKTNEINQMLLSGNELLAESAIRAGCRYYFGYPITPQNEISAYMAKRMTEVSGVFLQAESELAAINMVMGASAAGKRVMTSSSSPGISLMQEGISYLAGCELPALILNVMRGGPGLGSIGPSQSDYFQAVKGGGHGDYKLLVYGPSYLQEAVNIIYKSYEKAEKYRIPVMFLIDGIMGQMMENVKLPKMKKNKDKKFEWALTGCKNRKPRKIFSLYLKEEDLFKHNKKLQKKYKQIEKQELLWNELNTEKANLIIVAFGTCGRMAESISQKYPKKVGVLRPITLWPFPFSRLKELSKKRKKFLVVEMNEGQMLEDVMLACGEKNVDFFGISGGAIMYEEDIEKKIRQYIK